MDGILHGMADETATALLLYFAAATKENSERNEKCGRIVRSHRRLHYLSHTCKIYRRSIYFSFSFFLFRWHFFHGMARTEVACNTHAYKHLFALVLAEHSLRSH